MLLFIGNHIASAFIFIEETVFPLFERFIAFIQTIILFENVPYEYVHNKYILL